MKKPPSNTEHEEVDLLDFSDTKNSEIISDLGIEHLICRARAYHPDSWDFVRCERNDQKPYLVTLFFRPKRRAFGTTGI